jgi:hypothetical protein
MFLLKGGAPDKYRERVSQEVSGPGGGPVQVHTTNEEQRVEDFSEGFWRFMEMSGAIPGQEEGATNEL